MPDLEDNMKKHTETLVKIRIYKPELADRLISSWGTGKFFVVIDEILQHHKDFAATMTEAIAAIKADHRDQYPMAAPVSFENLPEGLAGNPDFKHIQERFPHIGMRLVPGWGTSKGLDYLESLFLDDRNGKRRGFPLEAIQSLIRLLELHNLTFPEAKKASSDPWELM